MFPLPRLVLEALLQTSALLVTITHSQITGMPWTRFRVTPGKPFSFARHSWQLPQGLPKQVLSVPRYSITTIFTHSPTSSSRRM
ncbi:uncharacterized protein BO95DRAFT_445672 [Aspergillus brunneoviolaceus CBS 621.78]|uniref:Uncharacterized protein n=1 Tax=Aspergillus brunneoviolaceus CBS 621.78 TaxID=1450534 RepID=A0ACD1G0J9_9EURO|nr:hypothetical protein BO95DRAFT_445672 [Aspergillus brunneoviolaceus CBS 621.78]RAH42760.1 hypothetical protein BO95DRAFT_445672 [Aspergillus brunneoviolaceus CBS 621.78]